MTIPVSVEKSQSIFYLSLGRGASLVHSIHVISTVVLTHARI